MIVTVVIIVVVVLLAVAAFSFWFFKKRETDPDALAQRRNIKATSATLKAATSRRDREISMVSKELRRAEKARQKAIVSADQQVRLLEDPMGRCLGTYRGVRLHELWISTPHGDGSLVGVTASVDSQVSTKKVSGAQYLSIDGPNFASVVACPQDQHLKAREFAVLINNAAKSARRLVAERPGLIADAQSSLRQAEDTSPVDHQKARLAAVESNPALLSAIAVAVTALNAARLGAVPVPEPPIKKVSLAKKPL